MKSGRAGGNFIGILVVLVCAVVLVLEAQGGERSVRAATRGPAKDIKALRVNGQQFGRGPRKFVEVEITPSEQLSEEDILGLPRAPGNDLEVLENPRRIKVQLAVEDVQALVEAGTEATVVRNFLLYEGSAAEAERQEDEVTVQAVCTGLYREGSNYSNYWMTDNTPGYVTVMSPISISGAWPGAQTTCLDVTWQVYHEWPQDVVVALFDYSGDTLYILWWQEYAWPGYFGGNVTGITDFAGEPVNQQWELWAGDWALYDQGYIDSWTIKVYYDDPSDYCSAAGGGYYEYISGVQVGSISNTPTGRSPYSDYTSMSTTMEIGMSYPIAVTNGYGCSADECGIWVDWNRDKDFYDAGEMITPVSGSPGVGPYTATITAPETVVLGETRLRVRIIDSTYNSLSPCGGASYGEVEDYTIIVVDALPVIVLNGPATVVLECGVDSYVEEGAVATDPCDGTLPVIIGGDTVDTSACGTYVVTYDATDSSGNAAEQVIRTVIVEDTTGPEITCPADIMVVTRWPWGEAVTFEAMANDLCDSEVEVVCEPPSGSVFAPGTTEVVCTATDASGNSSSCSFTVTVIEGIEMAMHFTPEALNPNSEGNLMKAHFVLAEGYEIGDVDANTPAVLQPLGIESEYINVFFDEGQGRPVGVEVGFERRSFCEAAGDFGPAEVTVSAKLTSGEYFYGADTIRIIVNNLKYLGVFSSNWLAGDCGAPDWCGGSDLDKNAVVDFADFALFDGCCVEVIKE